MATDVTPGLGHGALFTQAGVADGYDAIDLRRALGMVGGRRQEGPVTSDAYKVSQRGAGANMSVDIAANVGGGAAVQGDSVTQQGFYAIPPHTAVINEAIGPADATNPRVDQVILECLDDTHAGGGLNKARTRVVAGTPTSGATLDNRNGAAALPASAIRLADVLVGAGTASIVTANIRDRRPGAPSIISVAEARTNTAYGLLPTADQVSSVVMPQDGLLAVGYQALWQESVAGAARAAIFLGTSQLKIGSMVAPAISEASIQGGITAGNYKGLASAGAGLLSLDAGNASSGSDVTSGQVGTGGYTSGGYGLCAVFAAAGTYDVSVQFKASSGSVTAKERKLWAGPLALV